MGNNGQDFGQFLKRRRKNRKLTLSKLAELSGISPSYLSRIERGERNIPSALLLQKLAPHLGLTVRELLIAAGFLNSDTRNHPSPYNMENAPEHWQDIVMDPSLDEAMKEIGHLTADEKEGLLVYLKAIKLHREKGKQ